jgi:hypothetical protein
MCSIFERGVPLSEHVGSHAVRASRVHRKMPARLVSAQGGDSRSIVLRVCVVETSREEFVHYKQMLALSQSITTGPPV